MRVALDLAAARAELGLAELVPDRRQLVGDDRRHPAGVARMSSRSAICAITPVLADDLVLLEAGQPLQAHLQDFAGLVFATAGTGRRAACRSSAAGLRAGTRRGRPASRLSARGQHLAHHRRVPALAHQRGLRDRRRRRGLDGLDELVDVGQRDRQAFEHVAALARLAQLEDRAPRHDLAAVLEEDRDQVLQVAQLRLVVDQRDHVHAERVLQLRLLVQVVQHHLGHFAALELDHHPHARLVGLVLDVADALELLLVDQLGHALEQVLLVHLVRDLVDDDRLALALVDVLEVALGAHHDPAAPGAVALAHAARCRR